MHKILDQVHCLVQTREARAHVQVTRQRLKIAQGLLVAALAGQLIGELVGVTLGAGFQRPAYHAGCQRRLGLPQQQVGCQMAGFPALAEGRGGRPRVS